MKDTAQFPIEPSVITQLMEELHFDASRLSIREVNRMVTVLEERHGLDFVRMEFGVPNLPTSDIALKAEHEAVDRNVQARYPPFDGIPELKEAGAKFVKAFMDVEVPPSSVVPTCGAMQGGFVSQATAARRFADRNTILYLEPSFPVSKLQSRFVGLNIDSIDLYDHRGDKLIEAVRKRFAHGDVAAMIWSSPNNPAWICLKEEELAGLGKLCDDYEVIAIEDLAYLGMDFRQDYGKPYQPPFPPAIGKHCNHWIVTISSAKVFSYPGQRIGLTVISPWLMDQKYPGLETWVATEHFGHALIHGGIYCTTSGVAHTAQYGLAALLRAACSGELDFMEVVKVYGERAKVVRKIFLDHGFHLVYDNDLGEPLANGFYLTIAYEDMAGNDLLLELLRYGISTITLESAGSTRTEGLRACVSFTTEKEYPLLSSRLERFKEDHNHG